MKYIKLYENRHDFVFDEQRYFPNTALVNGEEEPSYFTDVEEVVFELTVTLPTEKVVTGQTYTLAVEYGGADVFASSTISTTGDVTLNGTQFTANTDGDFSVTATYDDKTVTLNGTSKLMTAAPTINRAYNNYGLHNIVVSGAGTKTMTFNGVEYTSDNSSYTKSYYEELTAQTVVVTATAQETGKWAADTVSEEYTIPAAQTLTATISDDTLDDGDTAQITVMYGSTNATSSSQVHYTASGDVTCTSAGVVTAAYSTGSGSIVVSLNNLPAITINVTVAQAAPVPKNIVFADNDVKSILVSKYGSNGEITEEQAAAVTQWFEGGYNNTSTNPFCKNANVDSFDEFAYFTGVTEIGEDAFQACSNMQSITLPSRLTSIPDYTFSGCSSLESVTIPAAVTYIGYRAFNGCSSLESITIGAGVSSMSTGVFDGCRNLAYMSVDTNNSSFNDGNGSNVIIDGSGNLLYGGGACSAIPNTVYTIANKAFSGIHLLNNTITIPSSVTSIGNNAFQHCDELTSITIPNSVTSIGGQSFRSCTGLTSLTIPASVTSIGNDAFNGCTSLSAIIFEGDKPTSLGARAFTNTNECPIYVPAAYVSNWSVYEERIQAIENIVFADNDVKSILATAFGSNGEITNAQAAAVTTFMSGTNSSTNPFYGNTNVNSFDEFATYFTGVTEIGNNAFAMCSNMTSITLPSRVTYIGESAFVACEKLESINIPETVTSIGNNAFYNCNSIKSITIPKTVTSIGVSAFNRCTSIQGITIPASVTRIGNEAFRKCSQLIVSGVTCKATTPPTLGSNAFSETSNCPIYVPEASLDAYKTAWGDYADRIQAIVVQYATAVLDCSRLKDANPLTECFNGYYDEELEEDVVYQEPRIDCTFSGNVAVENGVITMSDDSKFDMFTIEDQVESIGYVKLTHPSAEYKVDPSFISISGGGSDPDDITVTFDSATLTTTISNFVTDPEFPFIGDDFSMDFNSYGNNPIKITRIEVGYFTPSE